MTMKHSRIVAVAALAATAFGAGPALAHTGLGHTGSFFAGIAHPLGGLDHMLAMLSVGIWSALASRGSMQRLWAAPVAFIAAMLLGATMGYLQVPLPMVETGIALSVILLGLMIVARLELPVALGALVVALFAVSHGHAHGAEASGSIAAYMAGFVIATATLHVVGVGLGMGLTRLRYASAAAGTAIAAAGAYLLAF